jgi:hypothetical protein
MAMLKKVKAGMRTSLAISSIQEIPELKKYLMMTFTEMMMSWKPRKEHARTALTKWILFKRGVAFMVSSSRNPIMRAAQNATLQGISQAGSAIVSWGI